MDDFRWILPYLREWWVIKGILIYVIPWLIGWMTIAVILIELWFRWLYGPVIYWEDVTNARIKRRTKV